MTAGAIMKLFLRFAAAAVLAMSLAPIGAPQVKPPRQAPPPAAMMASSPTANHNRTKS